MDLAAITMDRNEARKRFAEYRKSVRERHSKEDEQIMRGYRALARGQQVIDLSATIRQGGFVMRGSHRVPRLAIMRADQKWCLVAVTANGTLTFHHKGWPNWNETRNLVRLPAGTLGESIDYHEISHWQHQAMVPVVPPGLRPSDNLGNYHILWEAEWEKSPPVDPALLKHIGGDLYAVLATWDLTDLERSVLAGRFR